MKIFIGSDHAGYDLKEKILKKYENSFEFHDCGCNSNESVDYPDFAKEVAIRLKKNKDSFGILICGSGIGISIAANRFKGIRAALCTTEMHAKMSRLHNNANILALGSRLTKESDIYKILETFFKSSFEGNRHKHRINKIDKI